MRTFLDGRKGSGSATGGRRRERSERVHPSLSAKKIAEQILVKTCNIELNVS